MAKVSLELIIKVAEIITNIAVVIIDALKGGNNKHDNTGSAQKK